MQVELRRVGTPATVGPGVILDIILRDEINHASIGKLWYRHLCFQRGLDPIATYAELARRHDAPLLFPCQQHVGKRPVRDLRRHTGARA